MMRIVFLFRGLLEIRSYPSACPSSEVLRCYNVRMADKATLDTRKRFPSPVRLVAVPTRRAGDARPCRPLRPDKNADFFRDLRAPHSVMLSGPTPNTARGSKIRERFGAFYHQRLAGSGCQRDSLASFPVQQLFDCCPVRFLEMPLPSAFGTSTACLIHHRAQTLALVSIRPRHTDIYANVTRNHIGRQNLLDFRELDKDPCNQSPLPLTDFAGRTERSTTAQRILEGAVGLCRHPRAGRWFHPVRVSRPFGFLNLRIAEQGKIGGAVKRLTSGFLSGKARVDNPTRPLLRLVGNPAQACCTLRLMLGDRALGKILLAVIQDALTIPPAGIARLFGFARIRLDLQRVRTYGARRFHRLGRSQYGDLHLPHRNGFSGLRGIQTCPQMVHVKCGSLSGDVIYYRVHYGNRKATTPREKSFAPDSHVGERDSLLRNRIPLLISAPR